MKFKKTIFTLLLTTFGLFMEATPNNVLFIIVDDLRPKLGCYGDDIAVTPAIDSLARDATLFERAYCQYPICNPSRSSFMSGMRPDTTGIFGNNQPAHKALSDALVLNRYLSEKGFATRGLGKIYHASDGPEMTWTLPYFSSEWLDYVRPDNKAIGDIYFTPKREKGQQVPASWEAEDVPDNAYCDGKVAEETMETLEELVSQGKPFFLATGFRHPHLPWCAPKKYWDLYDREKLPIATNRYFPEGAPGVATKDFGELWGYEDIPDNVPLTDELERQSLHAYYACASYADAQVGKLVDKLKSLGVYEDTVIVLLGDHGYQMGDNGVWCKGVTWESTNRTALMVRIPGEGKAGQRINSLVELIDLYPTICDAINVPVPEHCEGKSLIPLIDDPSMDWSEMAFSQLQRGNVMGRSIRTDRYRFTIWEEDNGKIVGRELYDMEKDPEGNVNLAVREDMQALVSDFTRQHRKNWPNN